MGYGMDRMNHKYPTLYPIPSYLILSHLSLYNVVQSLQDVIRDLDSSGLPTSSSSSSSSNPNPNPNRGGSPRATSDKGGDRILDQLRFGIVEIS